MAHYEDSGYDGDWCPVWDRYAKIAETGSGEESGVFGFNGVDVLTSFLWGGRLSRCDNPVR